MPHYADGTEAKVGDQVTGVLFNSGKEPKAGVIISITPGAESCNAQVQFTEAREVLADAVPPLLPEAPRMTLFLKSDPPLPHVREVRGEQHGSSGPRFMVFTCVDYTDTKNLTKVSGQSEPAPQG